MKEVGLVVLAATAVVFGTRMWSNSGGKEVSVPPTQTLSLAEQAQQTPGAQAISQPAILEVGRNTSEVEQPSEKESIGYPERPLVVATEIDPLALPLDPSQLALTEAIPTVSPVTSPDLGNTTPLSIAPMASAPLTVASSALNPIVQTTAPIDSEKPSKAVANPEVKVFFAKGSTYVSPVSVKSILALREKVQGIAQGKILIKGFADGRGNRSINQKLSELRAENVFNTLVSQGIPASRLQIEAVGESEAVQGGNWDERKNDRRVEIQFLQG